MREAKLNHTADICFPAPKFMVVYV